MKFHFEPVIVEDYSKKPYTKYKAFSFWVDYKGAIYEIIRIPLSRRIEINP
ncbi:hypothetical protein H0A61_02158 [Koleobacter methoxysyntrophicus]|uniref:Uncharacterized protein n=1 Tax=Koleobacter methoxysyntrophicus TaxID=2751313 RepID=A0A8A0RQV8_9FIRM|nr:hypothetical protein [Koleobacter methoxysyntrophicus]QSQ09777.1 hypothetical protein H0A61_02158 [Koleobacter methoxysyntrophicus]